MVKKDHVNTDSPHIPYSKVRKMVVDIEPDGEERRDTISRLAWRPAWAIRSRRGTIRVLKEMFRSRNAKRKQTINGG